MKIKRTFVIAVENGSYIINSYKNESGYFYLRTRKINHAKTWRYKKSCENVILDIMKFPDPSKKYISLLSLSIMETTDNKILRYMKLKYINRTK